MQNPSFLDSIKSSPFGARSVKVDMGSSFDEILYTDLPCCLEPIIDNINVSKYTSLSERRPCSVIIIIISNSLL